MVTYSTFWFKLAATPRLPSAFSHSLVKQFGEPRVVVTDKLRSYIKPIQNLAPDADHRAHKGLNNRIENSHRQTRKREKIMGRFKSPRQAQRFLSAHDQINTIFRPRRYKLSARLLAPRKGRCLLPVVRLHCRNDCLKKQRSRRLATNDKQLGNTSQGCSCFSSLQGGQVPSLCS